MLHTVRVAHAEDSSQQLGTFKLAKVPRVGDLVRLPKGDGTRERELTVVAVVHIAFSSGPGFVISESDPKVEIRVK